MEVSIINPSRIRHYALSMGQLAKTDPIDAGIINQFAKVMRPKPSGKPSRHQRILVSLVDRRQQLIDMRTMETNRLETPAADPRSRKMLEKHLRWLEMEMGTLEQKITETIRADDSMAEKAMCIRRIKGPGEACTTTTLLAHLPEIGTLSRQQIAALVGLAPYNTGQWNEQQAPHPWWPSTAEGACLYMVYGRLDRYQKG